MSINSYIYAASAFIPGEIVKSEDLMDELKSETNFGVSRTFINERMGIIERRFANSRENKHSFMASKAAEKLLYENNIDACEIDCVIYCGIERDYLEPGTSHIVQANIGSNGFCFDITNACHGFSDGMFVADSFIKRGFDSILLVTAEISSNITKLAINSINHDHSKFQSMFGALTIGDAAGAMLITSYPSEVGLKFIHFEMKSDSQSYKLCHYHFPENEFSGQMIMDKICARMLITHKSLLRKTLKKLDWEKPDFLITHQVGKRPHQRFSEMAKVDQNRMSKTFPKLGNIASATMPVNFCRTLKISNIKSMNILLMGAGSGLSISQIALSSHM